MKKILKLTVGLVALVVFLAFMAGSLDATTYKIAPTFQTAPQGWQWMRFSGTFIAAVDTFYCPVTFPLPKEVNDTILCVANLQTRAYSAAEDSIKVTLDYQWSSTDFGTTSGQTERAVGTYASILYDSTAQANLLYKLKTAVVTTNVLFGHNQPYSRFRVRGVTATAGGVANRIGVKWILDVMVPKDLAVVR